MNCTSWRLGVAILFSWAVSGAAIAAPSDSKGLMAHYCFEDPDNLAKDCKGIDNGTASGGTLRAVPGWRGRGIRIDAMPGQTAVLTASNSRRLQFKEGLTFMLAIRPDPGSRSFLMYKGGPRPSGECFGAVPGGWQPPVSGFGIDMQSVRSGENGTGTGLFFGQVSPYTDCYVPVSLLAWPGFVDGHWTHVAVTASVATGEVNIYLNGVPRRLGAKAFTKFMLDTMNTTPLTIARGLAGEIDEVKVFDHALAAEEIKAQFLAGGLAQPITALSDGKHIADVPDNCLFAGACDRTSDRRGLAGVDFLAAPGTAVRAMCDGKIDRVRAPADPAKRLVRLLNSGANCGPLAGAWSYYGHVDLDEGLTQGSRVSKGQAIGVVAQWLDDTGADRSRLHLAINRDAPLDAWGLVDTGIETPGRCAEVGVLPRREALMAQGWVDVAQLAPENGWLMIRRLGVCWDGGSPFDYVQQPYGKNPPYYPFDDF